MAWSGKEEWDSNSPHIFPILDLYSQLGMGKGNLDAERNTATVVPESFQNGTVNFSNPYVRSGRSDIL